jgi:hypothetical protein
MRVSQDRTVECGFHEGNAMTVRERAEDIAKNIDIMAEEIAKRSIPSSDESFREWSSQRLHERVKTHACSMILDYLLGESQALAALGATRDDAVPSIAISHEDAVAFAA